MTTPNPKGQDDQTRSHRLRDRLREWLDAEKSTAEVRSYRITMFTTVVTTVSALVITAVVTITINTLSVHQQRDALRATLKEQKSAVDRTLNSQKQEAQDQIDADRELFLAKEKRKDYALLLATIGREKGLVRQAVYRLRHNKTPPRRYVADAAELGARARGIASDATLLVTERDLLQRLQDLSDDAGLISKSAKAVALDRGALGTADDVLKAANVDLRSFVPRASTTLKEFRSD